MRNFERKLIDKDEEISSMWDNIILMENRINDILKQIETKKEEINNIKIPIDEYEAKDDQTR